MNSLVLELQHDAAKGDTPLPDILRKARMVASKLKLTDVNSWIAHELHGYPADCEVPEYRHLHGDVRAHNPYNGAMIPVRFREPEIQETISSCVIRQSIGSLFEATNTSSSYLQLPFPEQQMAAIRRTLGEDGWLLPFRKIDKTQIYSIFDAVRNRILDWTLKLESEGILGDGLTFSTQEKQRAAAMTSIQIGSVHNFQGVIGTMAGSSVQIDNAIDVESALKDRGFSDKEREEIQALIAEYKKSSEANRLSIAKKGLLWVVDNAEKLGALSRIFRDFFGS